jgi:hypothetical protein
MLYTYLDIRHVTSKNNNLKLSKNYNLKEIIWSELQKNCCDILGVPAVRSSLQAMIFGWFDMYFRGGTQFIEGVKTVWAKYFLTYSLLVVL